MTINVDTIFLLLIAFVAAYGLARIRHQWRIDTTKHLFVDEIACPKCGARPGVPCFFAGGYACNERFLAVEPENERRKSIRDKSSRAGRK